MRNHGLSERSKEEEDRKEDETVKLILSESIEQKIIEVLLETKQLFYHPKVGASSSLPTAGRHRAAKSGNFWGSLYTSREGMVE